MLLSLSGLWNWGVKSVVWMTLLRCTGRAMYLRWPEWKLSVMKFNMSPYTNNDIYTTHHTTPPLHCTIHTIPHIHTTHRLPQICTPYHTNTPLYNACLVYIYTHCHHTPDYLYITYTHTHTTTSLHRYHTTHIRPIPRAHATHIQHTHTIPYTYTIHQTTPREAHFLTWKGSQAPVISC